MRGRMGMGIAALTWALIGGTAEGVSYQFNALMSPPNGAETYDYVTLHLSGVWSDSCIPNRIAHHRVGETIYVEVEFPGILVACLQALTPWASSHILGVLPAGEYDVVGTYYAVDPYPPIQPREQVGDPTVWVTDYRVAGRVPGDIDHDGRVGPADLAMLVKEFGAKHPNAIAADVNGDSQVSLADLSFLARHLDTSDPTVVPEPASVVFALSALVPFVLASRRWQPSLTKVRLSQDTRTSR